MICHTRPLIGDADQLAAIAYPQAQQGQKDTFGAVNQS